MPTRDMGRSRLAKAIRRQQKIEATLDVSWKKYARCSLCNYRYVVNNYPDRKARVSQDKIGGKIVCPWCRHRYGKFGVQLMLLAEKLAAGDGPILCSHEEDCKCLRCVASRVLQTHAEAPTRR
jgi:hypothetical protein